MNAAKRIEDTFTILRAETMLSETDLKLRKAKIAELREAEIFAKKELEDEITELQDLQKKAEELTDLLHLDPGNILLLLIYREARRIHWHLDNMLPPEL